MRVLAVNAGSSTVKLTLLGDGDEILAADEFGEPAERLSPEGLADPLRGEFGHTDVVAHRIVHGGERFHTAIRFEAGVVEELHRLAELAPLHQEKALDAYRAVSATLPRVPAVACFDTAFHVTLPEAAFTFAVPASWRARWPVRRYGFHGLSHAWIARRAPVLLGTVAQESRIISAHLGSGASLCAIAGGRSVDTTMGFTPLDGLVMGTRAGSVDPGLLVWLLQPGRLSVDELADGLEHRSGLLALAGSADIRDAIAAARDAQPDALLALDVYVHRLAGAIAQMAAALGGVDALVFTGGIGEHSVEIRERAAAAVSFLGIRVDPERNAQCVGETDITASGAVVRTLVIPAREDLEMARQARELLAER